MPNIRQQLNRSTNRPERGIMHCQFLSMLYAAGAMGAAVAMVWGRVR